MGMILAVIGEEDVGKTTVAYNLSAQLDAVVDADLDHSLGQTLQPRRGPYLLDVLADRASPTEAVHEGGSVAILPCGRSLFENRAMDPRLTDAIKTVEHEYGRVVIHGELYLDSLCLSDDALSKLPAGSVLVMTTRTIARAEARPRTLARESNDYVSIALNKVRAPIDGIELEQAFRAPVTPLPKTASVQTAVADDQPTSGVTGAAFAALAESVQSAMRS